MTCPLVSQQTVKERLSILRATLASDWVRPTRVWRSGIASAEWDPLRVSYGGDIDSSRVSSDGVPVEYVGWRSFTANP